MEEFESGPFSTLYAEWTTAYPSPRDPVIEQRLAEVYRQAWATGDPAERESVLYFVMNRKSYVQDRDLILEGLASEDFRVAQTASAIADVARGLKGVEFGPELEDICRAASLRHPILDLHRESELRRPGDGWPLERPFIQLYEEWMSNDPPRDPVLAERLANLTQETWETGDAADKAFVVLFLSYRREPRAEWIIEGVQSEDYGLAHVALFEAEIMLRDGQDLGPDILRLAEEHDRRFPNLSLSLVAGIRLALQDREKSTQ